MKSHRSVFKDETKLDINYVPNMLRHREKEYRLLMEFFSFALQFPERMGQRVIITGDVGTGKTALAQRFGADLTIEANKRGTRIKYVHINCRQNRGKIFLVLQQAVTVFHQNYPARGYSPEELLKTLFKILDEENTHLILTLDEFDSIIEQEGSKGVYQLTRLQEMRPNNPQRVSLICIMRDLKVTEKLDASAKSTLQRNIISLEKYAEEQLIDILNDRIAIAFEPSTISDDTPSIIAELASSENGNARFAIELLWRAGKYADAEDADEVTPECVRKAISSIIPTVRKSELDSLELHEKLFLLGLARVFKESQKAYALLSEIQKAYEIVCENYGETPHSHTQLWKYVQVLSALGILKSEIVVTSVRGRATRVSLPAIPASELEKTVSASIENLKCDG